LLGAITVLAVLAYAISHRDTTPAVSFQAPVSPPASLYVPYDGPTQATVGSALKFSGTLPSSVTGVVDIEGSWNGAPSVVIARTLLANGSYSLNIPLRIVGTLSLRLALPDGKYTTGVIRVTPATVS
jgi:hypothetical protein